MDMENTPPSPRARRRLAGFTLAGVIAGTLTFYLGRGGVELLTAPRYRATLPVAAQVDAETARVRRTFLQRGVPTAPPAADVAETTDYGNWVRVPSLSLNFPLALAPSLHDADILRTLQIGVVRYPNGVEPGQPGVIVIAGHSTGEPWKGRYRFAFLNARKLTAGDSILIDENGTRYAYRVSGQRLLDPRTTPTLDSRAANPRLSIISCWPLWTTQQRLVIDAELTGKVQLVVRPSLLDSHPV